VTGDGGAPVARGLVARRLATPRPAHRAVVKAPLDDVVADAHFAARTSGSPFTRRLRVRVARLGPGRAAALLPYDPTITDHAGRVHEGALASLVDCAGGASAWSVAGFDPRGRAATVSMHLTFDVTPRDEDVIAVAETSWQAGTLLVNTVTLHGRTSGRAVATGSVTYWIVRPGA
jgi:acyl-coenzyme A thioesterase PaaI-like protein